MPPTSGAHRTHEERVVRRAARDEDTYTADRDRLQFPIDYREVRHLGLFRDMIFVVDFTPTRRGYLIMLDIKRQLLVRIRSSFLHHPCLCIQNEATYCSTRSTSSADVSTTCRIFIRRKPVMSSALVRHPGDIPMRRVTLMELVRAIGRRLKDRFTQYR